jgi:hypothetical protein
MQRSAVDAFLVLCGAITWRAPDELTAATLSFTYLISFLTQAWRLIRVWNSSGLGAAGSLI